ncbi:MAG: helix-turn-helix domain-containing protein [Deltaproteobacteria bacterium]|nr:helix-turn-helix domain-containing protein [Deltaproteobacteria bacterium]
MIGPDKRKAIYLLHEEGMGIRKIARQLNVSKNSVRTIIGQKGEILKSTRKDKIDIDPQLLRRLYLECDGWVQRIHEKLTEEHDIQVGYSTLTRQIRSLDLGQKNSRCEQVPDQPGAEMQHDTSPYRLEIGGQRMLLQGSLIYFRYSKIRYLKFYRSFKRFHMKCFFHEALSFWRYAAPRCIIDNTNLARLRGSGHNAVIAPEMIQFAKQYGFEFICHEINHPNRKAGNERGFYTVETIFFPGRSFASMEDLNRQAFEWATVRMPNRLISKTGLIPAKAFEYEQTFLVKLPPFISPPYLQHKRNTDQYGYASIDGNYYWIPGTSREEVTVLEYSDRLKIYCKRVLLAEYELPEQGVKNKKFSPPGKPQPKHQPAYRKKPTAEEEKRLSAVDPVVEAYLNQTLKAMGAKKHRFVRRLYGLYQKLAQPLFIKTIQRAFQYRITQIETLERIAFLLLQEGQYQLPSASVDQDLQHRASYQEGRFSSEVDFSVYEKLMGDDNE